MTEANDTNTTLRSDDDEGKMEPEPEEASDEIPASLLSYFQTSRSRAVICERLILEEPEDLTELDSVVDFSSPDNDLESLNELQINSFLVPGFTNTEALSAHGPLSDDEAGTDVEEVTEEQWSRSEGSITERDRRVCEELKMEEQRKRREAEFEQELRRLEEAERLQQAELELMAKRAQEKLEQEMLLQQEMMKDLKQRVEEERKRRMEEQVKFKQEQEKRQEEERRKTEELRQRQNEETVKVQTENVNVVLEITNQDEVKKDGSGKQTEEVEEEEERQKAQITQNNAEQDKALTVEKAMDLKTNNLEGRANRGADIKQNNEFERKQRDLENNEVIKAYEKPQGKTDKDIDKTKVTDEEVKATNKSDKMAEAKQTKEEEVQEMQYKGLKGTDCNVGFQNKTHDKEENSRDDTWKGQQEEEKENGTERQVWLTECSAEDENKGGNLMVQHNPKATNEKPNLAKDNGKKKISISCNFLRNSFKFKQKTASDISDGSSIEVEMGDKGKSKMSSSSLNLSTSSITDTSNITTAKEEESSSNKTSSRSNMSQNEFKITQETTHNGSFSNPEEVRSVSSSSLLNVSRVSQETALNGCNGAAILETTNEREAETSTNAYKCQNVSTVQEKRCEEDMNEVDKKEECSGIEELSNFDSSQDAGRSSSSRINLEHNLKKDINKAFSEEDNLIKAFEYEIVNEEDSLSSKTSSSWKSLENESHTRKRHDYKKSGLMQAESGNSSENGKGKPKTTSLSSDPESQETGHHDNSKRITKTSILETGEEADSSKNTKAMAQDGDKHDQLATKNPSNVTSFCNQSENKTCQSDVSETMNTEVSSTSGPETKQHGSDKETTVGRCRAVRSSSRSDLLQNDSKISSKDTTKLFVFETGNEGSGQTYSNSSSLENVSTKSQEKSLCRDKTGSNQTSTSADSLQNVSEVSRDVGHERSNHTDILRTRKEGEDKNSSSSNVVQIETVVSRENGNKDNIKDILETKKHIENKNSSSYESFETQTSGIVTGNGEDSTTKASLNCDSLLNVSKNSHQSENKTNEHTHGLQNVVTETSQRKNNNKAAILETGDKEEGVSNKASCDFSNTASVIGQERKENDCDAGFNTDNSNENEEVVVLSLCLPEKTEQKRLKWMRECVPWSRLQNKRTDPVPVPSRRGPKRTSAAAAAGGGATSPPPLPPQTLLQTTGQRSLRELTSVTLEDLPGCSLSTLSQCPRLQSLTLRRCGLRALDHISQLQHLCSVNVQENEISHVDCENMSRLRVLRLGHNRLRSIHGLNGAEDLALLDLSHNSIRRIAGVESLRRLRSLSLSHNQLTSSRGLSSLSSLMDLDLSHNHLDSVVGLDHCGLLCSLDLRSNSLTEPPDLKNHVLLRELHLDDNSISSLHSLSESWLPMMQHLTAAQNSVTQLPSCLSDFVSLETLDLRFNCISELSGVCENLKLCPFIRDVCVDGNPLQQESGWRSTLQKTVAGLRSIDGQLTDSPPAGGPCSSPVPGSFLSLCQSQIQQIRELQQRHSSQISAASSPLDALITSCRHLDDVFHLAEEHRFQHEYGDTSGPSQSESSLDDWTKEESSEQHIQNLEQNNAAAALIQQRWRQECPDRQSPSTDREEGAEGGGEDREQAATVIQAFWRGVSLRRRLRSALAQAECPDGEWDESFEELDVDEFVFDEASLETDWSLRLSEDYTDRRFPELERPLSAKVPNSSLGQSLWFPPPVTDLRPKQAWTSEEQVETVERASPSNSVRNKTPPSSAVLHGLSERSEKIVEEWGFTDSHTALLMLKRARKMKSKKEQQQKLKDPNVRLALFKTCSSQMRSTEPQSRPRALRNRPFLQVGEAALELEQSEEQRNRRRQQTQTHTQSECFLPKMSWDILNGGRVQLVADPGRLRSGSQSCLGISGPPRNSAGKSRKEAPSPKRVSSAPTKKERISFRDNKVQLSGGWGSGKKRLKVVK